METNEFKIKLNKPIKGSELEKILKEAAGDSGLIARELYSDEPAYNVKTKLDYNVMIFLKKSLLFRTKQFSTVLYMDKEYSTLTFKASPTSSYKKVLKYINKLQDKINYRMNSYY